MMTNGASGDVNNVNRGETAERSQPWKKMQNVAADLAEATARLCREIEYRDSVPLSVATCELDLAVRRPDEARLRWARQMVEGIHDREKLTRPQDYADEALALAAGPERIPVPLQAIRIGPLGIAAAPCEVFAQTALEIKQRSTLKPTL